MKTRRLAPFLLLIAAPFAVLAWWAPSVLAPDSSATQPAVDAIGTCAQPPTAGPSFCVALPTPGPSADRAELLVRRQDVCAQLVAGEAPDFCLVVPAGGTSTAALQREVALALLRQRLGTDFRRTTAGGVQLWTEVGVSGPIVDAALGLVAADAAAVELFFGRPYQERPAVFLFTSQQSFGLALQRHFGVDAALAARLSHQLLGVLLTGSDAVAINGQSIAASGRPVVYRHELTHVLIHQLAGNGVPNWLDEGLATRVSAVDPGVIDPQRAAALTALRTDPRALSVFTDRRDWQTVNSAYGDRAYGVAAEAVLALERRVERNGVTALLEALGRGASLEDAFRSVTGETLDDFIARLPAVVH